ncbi:MAG: ATP-binding protein [Planctomycetota bacterium]
MQSPQPHHLEAERVAILLRCGVLDTPPEAEFDTLTRLASRIAGTPIGLVSLVDETRQWFKSRHGLDAAETSRRVAFCAHAIVAAEAPLIVEDARLDARFDDNPLVTGEPRVIFYAGLPLRVGPERLPIGTLCVIDHEPRQLTTTQLEQLELLARQAEVLLELRLRQRELEEQLMEVQLREERTQASIAAMNDGMVVQRRDGSITSCNAAAERILGLTADQMCGRTSLDARWNAVREDGTPFPGEEHPAMVTLRTGAPLNDVVMGVGLTGGEQRWIMVNSRPVGKHADGLPEAVVATFADITKARRHEAELVAAREAAERADRAKSAFLATMSHEIRTPLNGVLGLAELLEQSELDAEQRSMLVTLRDSGRSLLTLINDILDWSKIQAGHMQVHVEPVPALAAAGEALESLRAVALERGLDLRLEGGPPDTWIHADPQRLRQVLLNLIGNALKFTERGSVTVRVHGDEAQVTISIEDSGIGIPEAQLPRLFTRFTQVDEGNSRRFGGTGLGLAISKQLCEAMGGAVAVTSVAGKGSTFAVSLPRAARPATASRPTESTSSEQRPDGPAAPARALRVLLAEDNAVNQKVAALMLERLGHSVTIVDNGLRVLEADLSAIDLVLMDVQMPLMDGLEATRQLRNREAHAGQGRLPILALTASTLLEERAACLDAGMDGVLTKPITSEALSAGLDAVP